MSYHRIIQNSGKKRSLVVSPRTDGAKIRQRIRRESAALGLSQQEYLDALTQLAEAIRENIWPQGAPDAQMLKAIVEKPFLLQMVSALAGTLWNTLKESTDETQDPPCEPQPTQVDRIRAQTAPPEPAPQGVPTLIDPFTGRPVPWPYPPVPGHPY